MYGDNVKQIIADKIKKFGIAITTPTFSSISKITHINAVKKTLIPKTTNAAKRTNEIIPNVCNICITS